jgi:hypothetical protein
MKVAQKLATYSYLEHTKMLTVRFASSQQSNEALQLAKQ